MSPAGAAVGLPLSDHLKRAYFVDDLELSPLACAYARARGADRVSSYGDRVALSEPVDSSTARLLRREFSCGVIAPGYEATALEILRKKFSGKYVVLQMDPRYVPDDSEFRDVFGLVLRQRRNDLVLSPGVLQNVVSGNRNWPSGICSLQPSR